MAYGKRTGYKRGRSTPYRRRPTYRKKATYAVARKKPRAARFALAKRVDTLARAVKKNTAHRFGDLQMSQQVTVGQFSVSTDNPALFIMDDFATCLDSQTPSAANCPAIYNLSGGALNSPTYFNDFNHNFAVIPAQYDGWQGTRVDKPDTGKYLATSASYTFHFEVDGAPANDVRFKLTFFKLRRNKYQNHPTVNLISILNQGKYLLAGNHLSPVQFRVIFQKEFYLNSAQSVTEGGSGPRTRKWSHYFKMNHLVTQNQTTPTAPDAQVDHAWSVEDGQRDIYQPMYCMISTTDPSAADEDVAKVHINRVVRWKDTMGQAFS